jgi:hypothetical protein
MTVKRRKVKHITGQETINQIEHIEEMGARAVSSPVNAPGKVISTDTSAAGVFVGLGSILRIEATAGIYIAFGDSANGAVSASTSPGFKHPGGYVLLNATDDFVRSSAALTRVEVINA